MAQNDDIFGTTAGVDAGAAVEAVQAEEIRRLETQGQTNGRVSESTPSYAASPTPSSAVEPLTPLQAEARQYRDEGYYLRQQEAERRAQVQAENRQWRDESYYLRQQRQQGPPAAAPSGWASAPPTAFSDAQALDARILEQTRNEFSAPLEDGGLGMHDMVGTPLFNDLVARRQQQERFDAGLAASPDLPVPHGHGARGFARAAANFKEDWNDESGYGKLNYAFAAAELGQAGGQYYQRTNSGAFVSPEQQGAAAAGLLPGALGMAGVAVGAMVAPGVGSWVGGMVGAGIGTVAQGVIGANETRAEATREAAERLAASLGSAADSVGTFKTLLEATGAPIQQIGQGLTTLQGLAPGVGSAAVGGAGRSALAQGEFFGPDTAETGRFLASAPSLAPLLSRYAVTGTELSRGEFSAIADQALAVGDMGAFNSAQMQASRSALNGDPQYQAAAKTLEAHKPLFGTSESWYNKSLLWLHDHLPGTEDEDDNLSVSRDAQKTMDERRTAVEGMGKADTQRYTDEFLDVNRGRQELIDAGLRVKIGQTGFATAQATGASASALRGLMPGIGASIDASFAADQTLITTDTGLMNGLTDANDPTGSLRTQYQTLINQAKADQVQNPLAKAEIAKTVFGLGLAEDESAFGLDVATRQGGLTRGLLSGRRYDELAGDENGFIRTQTARAAQIRRDAASPIVNPALRSRMLAEAVGLETGAAVERHDFQMRTYGQALQAADLGVGVAGLAVDQARAFGTPGAVSGAQGQEADALRGKLRELFSEIGRGGLTADELAGKLREVTQAGGQLNAALAQQRDDRIAAARGMAEGDLTISTAGVGRQIRVGGTGSVDAGAIDRSFFGLLAADRSAVGQYAPGSQQRKDAEARLATDQARFDEEREALNVYSPGAATRIGDVRGAANLRRAEAGFSLEQISPYRTGEAGSSPFTRALGLEEALRSDVALQGRDQAQADAFRIQRTREGRWTTSPKRATCRTRSGATRRWTETGSGRPRWSTTGSSRCCGRCRR